MKKAAHPDFWMRRQLLEKFPTTQKRFASAQYKTERFVSHSSSTAQKYFS